MMLVLLRLCVLPNVANVVNVVYDGNDVRVAGVANVVDVGDVGVGVHVANVVYNVIVVYIC